MPPIKTRRTTPHHFVPADLDAADAPALTHLFDLLEAREIATRADLESLIGDYDELNAFLYEAQAGAYIDMTVDTTSPAYERRYLAVVENMVPIAEKRGFRLKQKLLASPAVAELGGEYAMLLRDMRAEVTLFREANVPLQTQDMKLGQEYEKISGAQQATFRGETYTLQRLAPFLEATDRATREEAWRARAAARLADAAPLDALYDRMVPVRQQIAHNAGFADYRDYQFQNLKRFDYTPADAEAFHAAIARHVTPVVVAHMERRRRLLGVDTLRPWDLDVDPEGPPLHPFETVDQLIAGCGRIFARLDPELGGFFTRMVDEDLLDLANRPGKAAGGYMEALTATGVPFIFMNAVGVKRDVSTLLHEGGHAFHYFLARPLPLNSYHMTGQEFSEVASQTMELLGLPYLDEFYTPDEIARLHDEQLRFFLFLLVNIAITDAFQHWVYTTPGQDAAARRAKWGELTARFLPGIDWSSLEEYRDASWQILHVFTVPFYYIEYGIALLAALRIWLNSLDDAPGAVAAYKRGLALGGSRPLPALFAAAGATFGLDDATVAAIVAGTTAQLEHS